MAKKDRFFLDKIIFLVCISALMILIYLFNLNNLFINKIIGLQIDESVKSYGQIPNTYFIFLILIWIGLLIFIIVIFIKDKIAINMELVNISQYGKKEKISTNIDIMYEVLSEKGKLKVSTLSKAFNVKKEKIIEWARILETGNLAVIEYPLIGEPHVRAIKQT
jgi:hypothetical protein